MADLRNCVPDDPCLPCRADSDAYASPVGREGAALERIARDVLIGNEFHSPAAAMLGLVDAILAAGWRPPARLVETDEQLVADVPDRAIVLSAAGTIACRFDYGTGVVFGDDRPFPWGSLQLPGTVLWEPEVSDHA